MKHKEIWKFELKKGYIKMPIGAQILSIQVQNERPMIWALVDPNAENEPRWFSIIGTGEDFNDTDMTYIGTFQDLPFVWHVFEYIWHVSEYKQQDNG